MDDNWGRQTTDAERRAAQLHEEAGRPGIYVYGDNDAEIMDAYDEYRREHGETSAQRVRRRRALTKALRHAQGEVKRLQVLLNQIEEKDEKDE